MPEYFLLFAAVCDAIDALETLKNKLIEVTQQAEEIYISRPD